MAGRERKGTEVLSEKKSYWAMAARECDSCRSTPALLFCRTHSAFLCGPCDGRVHAATPVSSSPHERVWMCEVCEQAPAAFTCKADAATLCAACDADIHSANPLALRHDRAHVVPFLHSPANTTANPNPNTASDFLLKRTDDFYEEKEMEAPKMKMKIDLHDHHDQYFFAAVDPYLDLEYGSSMENTKFHHHADSVVPAVQNISVPPPPPPAYDHHVHFFGGGYDLDFMNSNQTCSYAPSLNHSVSSELGVVPEGSTATDMTSNSYDQYGLTVNQSAVAKVATGTDREARVMRYMEKKKNRKFEKTIRYASRKAYAETRPRVKGRFVKRTELDCEGDADAAVVDSIYASSATAVAALMVDAGYGVVPSF